MPRPPKATLALMIIHAAVWLLAEDSGAFAPGQTYVALSRLTSLDGLYLTRPLRPSDIRVDEDVRRFMRGVWERQGAQMRVS